MKATLDLSLSILCLHLDFPVSIPLAPRTARFAPWFLWRLLLRDLLPELIDIVPRHFPSSNGAVLSRISLDRALEVPTIT